MTGLHLSPRDAARSVGAHPRLGRAGCSSRAAVRNPLLALTATAALQQLEPDVRAAMRAVLLDLAADARSRADESWRRHKAPMAAYWKAVSVYAGHFSRVLR